MKHDDKTARQCPPVLLRRRSAGWIGGSMKR